VKLLWWDFIQGVLKKEENKVDELIVRKKMPVLQIDAWKGNGSLYFLFQ